MITYTNSNVRSDLEQIIALQQANLARSISETEAIEQGFVTVQHHVELLQKMGATYPHTIARDGEKVIGYALAMGREFRFDIPVLVDMFETIDQLQWNNRSLKDINYTTMGQVCIDKAYRGQGVFKGLYHQMRTMMQPSFELLVTEIAKRNTRSFRAHEKVGFQLLHEYPSDIGIWQLVVWDWS